MPVAPYGTDKYREWTRERMRRYRVAGYDGDARYKASERGRHVNRRYEVNTRPVRREAKMRGAILALAGLGRENAA